MSIPRVAGEIRGATYDKRTADIFETLNLNLNEKIKLNNLTAPNLGGLFSKMSNCQVEWLRRRQSTVFCITITQSTVFHVEWLCRRNSTA
jgi:hypothetical protein